LPRRSTQSLICLNPARRWKIGFDGDLKVYDLRYALAHEIGHAIGLDHPAVGQIRYRYDNETALFEEVRNASRALAEAVARYRACEHTPRPLADPRPK